MALRCGLKGPIFVPPWFSLRNEKWFNTSTTKNRKKVIYKFYLILKPHCCFLASSILKYNLRLTANKGSHSNHTDSGRACQQQQQLMNSETIYFKGLYHLTKSSQLACCLIWNRAVCRAAPGFGRVC